MPEIPDQQISDDECDRLYRESLTIPSLLAEIQHHCELLGKAIGERAAGLSEAEQRAFQSLLTFKRESEDLYANVAELTGSPYEASVALNLIANLRILLDLSSGAPVTPSRYRFQLFDNAGAT